MATDGTTLKYDNTNADSFVEGTINVESINTQDRFLKLLPEGAHVLDFGYGSGCDTKSFLKKSSSDIRTLVFMNRGRE